MKLSYSDISYLVAIIALLIVVIKFFLWINLNPKRRIGFFKSFIAWYSVHDIHNAGSSSSKRFRKTNNILNVLFFACLAGLIAIYVADTSGAVERPIGPPKK